MMKSYLKIVIIGLYFVSILGIASATIPAEYMSNYRFASSWDQVNEAMVRVEAMRKTSTEIPTSLFSQLNTLFQSVFQYLPQGPNEKVTYEQCRITTQRLSNLYNFDDFGTFYNQCYNPLLDIIDVINSQRTVRANIIVNPAAGPAPMNVTFDARNSSDPSQDTIPNENFYRYFSDVDGVRKTLGVGPVINHTFARPGKYIVHLTARSVNWRSGVFDGETTAEVNVSPQSATINVFVNGKRMKETSHVKLGTTEAQKGISLDGSSTSPTGGRRILRHIRTIRSNEFSYSQEGQGNPSVINVALPGNGQYDITLTTFDNENNEFGTTFPLIVSDPVATIKSTPEQGTTSTQFLFDGSNSYAVTSRLKTYKREIFDPNGNLNDTIQARQINKQFSQPGLYTIKLTVVDELGQSNIDQLKLYVESTQPVPQFIITPTQQREKPSQFILDATNSSDVDQINGDTLSYERKFTNPDIVKVEQYSENKQKAIITINQAGNHNVTLTVRDSYGKYSDITKTINVVSTLRPVLNINPVATIRGRSVNFEVKTNKPIINYQWDFGDGANNISQFDKIVHTYNKVGIYPITLTVTDGNMESNTIRTQLFVGEVDKPIALYRVTTQQSFDNINNILLPIGDCDGKDAFLVDRYQTVFIDASMSVNTKGTPNNLNVYFKPKNDQVITATSIKQQFAELGCQSIELTVQDQIQTSQDKQTIYFRVRNALPRIGNIIMNFPQYGNDTGIGFFNEQASDPSFETFDPLVVRLNAENFGDNDGYISYFTWYYYKNDDPGRILDLKITPGNTPTVTFALSREAGEYVFGVKLTDSDEESIRSESVIGKGPVIFLKPKGGDVGDIPIVTLKSSQTNLKVGEEVIFTTNSKILSSRDDFIGTRVFKYDFDGDGVDDLTTKLDEVTYTYTGPSPEEGYKPKVKVLYRGKVGVGYGDTIVVQKGIRPNFMYQVIDKKILISDLTLGAGEGSTIAYCMNMKYCAQDASYLVKDQKAFIFEYPTYGKFVIKLEVKDAFGNIESKREIIDVQPPRDSLPNTITTLPQLQSQGGVSNVSIGKSLDNTLLIYVSHSGSTICGIDIDNTKDTNNDSNLVNDNNLTCNQFHQVKFESAEPTITLTVNEGESSRPVVVNLIDNQTSIAPEFNQDAEEITAILGTISGMSGNAQLQQALLGLRSNLGDTAKTTEFVIDIQNLTQGSTLDTSILTRINVLLAKYNNASIEATNGSNPVVIAQAEILALVDGPTKQELTPFFDQLNSNGGDKELVIVQLNNILSSIKKQLDNNNFDPQDFEIIKQQICTIADYREVALADCGNSDLVAPPETNSGGGGGFATVLRVIIIIIIAVGSVLVGVVIYFALKARRKLKAEKNL